MLCPACKQPMIVVEHQGIELDHCLACKGTWFDSGELELLFEGLGACAIFPRPLAELPEAECGEKHRRCPRCSKKMRKIHLGEGGRVLVDACPLEDGLWFDAGEVGAFIQDTLNQLPGAAGKTLTFLGQAFSADLSKGGNP